LRKAGGLPLIAWYEALWGLGKAGEAGLHPFELERAMLFEQYKLLRPVERLVNIDLLERCACSRDGWGQALFINRRGKDVRAHVVRLR